MPPSPQSDDEAIAPFFLVEPGGARPPCMSDADSPAEVFEEEGHSGNGSSWAAVARAVIADISLENAGIDVDSEAGTFVALASSRAALVTLGRHLATLLRDAGALRRRIREVPDDAWDD